MSATTRQTRISLWRVVLVLVLATLVGFWGVRAFSSVILPTEKPGVATFAGYVDVTATPTYPFGTPSGPAQSQVILSFVVADSNAACAPSWGGYYSLAEAGDELELDRRISQLRSTGGDARVSFGGQRGTELAASCADVDALRDAYSQVVDRYELTSIDLDVEGASLSDTDAGLRRAEAIKAVQDAAADEGRSLTVWLTLPVATSGLTAEGVTAVDQMLSAGVDLAGVNGMAMDFGSGLAAGAAYSEAVLNAATALHHQVQAAYTKVGISLDDTRAWSRVGITVMVGQNDVVGEVFTISDAADVNEFARDHGVGQVAMWSLNRDSTCQSPLPTVLSVVQTSCSGIDQGSDSFAVVLSTDLPYMVPETLTASPSDSAEPTVEAVIDLTDDPATSPFPIWDPLGTYPGGTKIVWHHNVYEARYWSTGVAPDTPVASAWDSPWTLVGPVMPGDTPAPLPTLPEGTYPQWDPAEAYVAGTRVQLGLVPYQAKWWTQGQEPGENVAGGSPWILVMPEGG